MPWKLILHYGTGLCNWNRCCSILEGFDIHGWCTSILLYGQLPHSWVFASCFRISFQIYTDLAPIKLQNLNYTWWLLLSKICHIFREAMIPCILLAVGGNLVDGKNLFSFETVVKLYYTDITPTIVIVWWGDAFLQILTLAFVYSSGPGEGSKRLGVRTTVAIIFARLILVPIAGVGIVMLVDKLGFIPKDDKMFKFVLLLQHSMPTSVLSGMRK